MVNIPPQHKIGKTIMIYGCNVTSYNTGVNTLLTNVNRKQALQPGLVITQKTMNSQQTHHTEVPQHLQDIASTTVIIPISSSKLFKTLLLLLQYLDNI